MKSPEFPIDQIREIFYFDSSGILFYKKDSGRWGRVKAGSIAGGKRFDGYLEVRLKERCFLVHHIIWALHTGAWPTEIMDHINGIRDDNRIENLREAGAQINCENKHIPQKNNKIGLMGVHKSRRYNGYLSKISVRGKHIYLGSFKTPEEAHAAYIAAKRMLHEGCTI
jgi:hypothetical protein